MKFKFLLLALASVLCSQTVGALTLLVYNNNNIGAGSLRQAIQDNGVLGGGNTIIFSNVVTGTITLTSGELLISKNVTIIGPGANLLAVSGNAASRIFHVTNATVSISGLTITNGNTGVFGNGGGIYNDRAILTVSNCTLSGNVSTNNAGGGIFNNGFNGSATLTITASTFSGNTAYGGGGIYNDGGNASATLTITASTFSGNTAHKGGGIYNDGGNASATLTITASTFSGNIALDGNGNGGGIYNLTESAFLPTFLDITDTILKAGASGENIQNPNFGGGTVTSHGYNLSSDNGGGYLTALADQINTDPMLGPLQDNGGPTPTMIPQAGSPAIDQGTNAAALPTDQRGRPRIVDNPAIPNATLGDGSDIGAVEVPLPTNLIVANNNDSGAGSLRQAIQDNGALGGGNTIIFSNIVSGTITLTSGELAVGNSLSIVGSTTSGVIVSGNNSSRVFHLTAGTVSIANLTIANGNAINSDGGGLLTDAGSTLSINNCTFSGNTAGSGGINVGGGLANNGTTLATNCTFSGNHAPNGGGLYNFATVFLQNCTVSANSASSGGGYDHALVNSVNSVGSTIIAGNTASLNGPDIFYGFTSRGYNLIGKIDAGSGFVNGVNQDQVGSIASPVNPLLGPLQNNGGPTFTHALLAGSPAIDAGKSTGLTTDQRGRARPYDYASVANASGGDGSDIGAFELQPNSPLLSIARSGNNVLLAWSTNDTGFTLQANTNLASSVTWSNVPGNPAIVGSQYVVSNTATGANKFYRLKNP